MGERRISVHFYVKVEITSLSRNYCLHTRTILKKNYFYLHVFLYKIPDPLREALNFHISYVSNGPNPAPVFPELCCSVGQRSHRVIMKYFHNLETFGFYTPHNETAIMGPLRKTCSNAFKIHARRLLNHKRCETTKIGSAKKGDLLNYLLNSAAGPEIENKVYVNVNEWYYVCSNMVKRCKEIENTLPRSRLVRRASEMSARDKAPRRSKRRRGSERDSLDFSKIRKVHINVPGDTRPNIEVNEIKSNKQIFADDVMLRAKKKYRRPFKKLKYYQRKERVKELSRDVVASCFRGYSDLEKNKQLGIDVITLLDEVKMNICMQLNLSFTEIQKYMTPPADHENEEDEDKPEEFDMAVALLGEVTAGGYNRLRSLLVKTKWTDVKKFPSFYKLTQSRPRVDSTVVLPVQSAADPIEENEAETDTVDDAFVSISLDDVMETLERSNEALACSRLYGSWRNYFDIMVSKHTKKNRNLVGNIAIIDSYDGAIHSNSDKERCNIVSFSSQVFSNGTVTSGISTASSKNILTWLQFIGEEKFCNLLPTIYLKTKLQRSSLYIPGPLKFSE